MYLKITILLVILIMIIPVAYAVMFIVDISTTSSSDPIDELSTTDIVFTFDTNQGGGGGDSGSITLTYGTDTGSATDDSNGGTTITNTCGANLFRITGRSNTCGSEVTCTDNANGYAIDYTVNSKSPNSRHIYGEALDYNQPNAEAYFQMWKKALKDLMPRAAESILYAIYNGKDRRLCNLIEKTATGYRAALYQSEEEIKCPAGAPKFEFTSFTHGHVGWKAEK